MIDVCSLDWNLSPIGHTLIRGEGELGDVMIQQEKCVMVVEFPTGW